MSWSKFYLMVLDATDAELVSEDVTTVSLSEKNSFLFILTGVVPFIKLINSPYIPLSCHHRNSVVLCHLFSLTNENNAIVLVFCLIILLMPKLILCRKCYHDWCYILEVTAIHLIWLISILLIILTITVNGPIFLVFNAPCFAYKTLSIG